MIPSFTSKLREIQWGALQASVISKKQILTVFAILCLVNLSIAQTSQTFSSSGTWQAPAGVTTLKVECWGGGGRGGSTVFSGNETGGGGGGAYARLNSYVLAPGTTYTVTVGSGSTSTSAGGDSWFNSNSTVLAKGGSTVANNGTNGASGGSAAASIGDVKFSGGNGANGSSGNYGGGGGSSAGTGAAGANGSTSNGGTAPTGGGNGGNGRTASNGNGNDGVVPGGGGGGVRSGNFGSQTGGDGANGRVILTWTCPTYDLSSTAVASSVCIGSSASISLTSSAAGLPAGTYTVTYSLSGANTGTGLTTTMTVSSAGTGSFNTGVLANSGNTNITITQLSSGAGAAICNSSITVNNTATISVGIVNAGSISGTQSTCFGGDPTLISNAVSGSGDGTITYSWESSTTNATTGFTAISGATADSYDPPAGLTATTWYRRITISTNGAAVCQATSNAVQVTVSTTQLPSVSAAASSSLSCAGAPFNLFANTNAGYSATVSPALAIPDNNSAGITSIITTSGLPTSLAGWKVIVTVNITHTWTSDIELFLARPGGGFGTGNATNHVGTIAGQSIRLSNDNGGSGDGYANCTFRDDAATNVTTQTGNVTISGNFIPEELLSTLSGNPNGNWTLRVSDDAADDLGTLTSWTLQIVYPNGLSYSWTSAPSGFTSALQNPTGVSANENTTYTVVQTDLTTGCTQSSSVSVNAIANPSPKVIPGDSVLCSGTDLYVHVIDTGAYAGGYPVGSLLEWVNIVANQNVLDSLNVNGNGSIYQAIITTPDGCTGISPVRTIVSKSIIPNETITHATCNLANGKIAINMVMGTAPFHYVWKSGSTILKDTISSSPLDSILNLATGNYTLEISDNFGNVNPLEPSCSSIVFSYTVNEVAPPAVNIAGTNISCFGQNDGQAIATPSLGTAPYSYIWSNSETTQSIINLGPGTYTVTVTDATGCSSEGQVTILEPSAINIALNYTEPLCTGTLTGIVYSNVSGGTPPYNYEWFDSGFLPEGLNDDTLLNIGADTYYLVITDANGCIGSNTILVEDPPLLSAVCSATPATCFGGGDGSVSILSSGGRGFHTYLWNTGDVTTSVTGLEAGTYTATVTDGNGCTAICTAIVSQPDLVSGSVTGSDVNCINDQTSVVVTATGGTAPHTGEGTFTVGVGTHTFPLTDSNGCTGSASITINHLDADAPVISNCPSDITQCGDIVTWTSPTAIDNCTLVSFTSDFNSGASFPVGATLVTYTATDNAGLVSTCSFTVTILPTPIWYADADGDGFGNPLISLVDCIQPIGYVSDNSDCDDSQILYADTDGDLYGAGSPAACGAPVNGDCDDNNASVNPSAIEVCNSIDDDCDGSTDEGVLLTFYADTDADTYGNAAATIQACTAPVGFVADNTDCDDNNAAVNPAATEVCNGIDDDCDGLTEEGLTFLNYYVDGDNDGFGAGAATSSCAPIAGSVLVDGDCDDNNTAVNPAAVEVCNNIDDDCNGLTDDGLVFLNYYVDGDNDGFGAGAATSSCNPIAGSVLVVGDCDDNNAAINPSATEVCNNIDDDCNGLTDDGLVFLNYYVDADNDGFGAGAATSSCNPIAGSVLVDGDCDDNNAAVNPASTEVCNNIDDDCNGLTDDGLVFLNYYVDADNDGFGAGSATSSCAPIAGSVLVDGDCDDNNAAVNPAATEVCNSIDDDCDGSTDEGVLLTFYADVDADTYGNAAVSTLACSVPVGYVADNTDCDDNNIAINPSSTEVCGNGIDDNCDTNIDEGCILYTYFADTDNDTYGDPLNSITNYVSTPPVGYVTDNTDCNDNNAAVNPAATEVCNTIDDDCDGSTDEGVLLTFYADADADSYGNAAVSTQACSAPVGYVADNTDCDDNNAAANPAATEICNAIDDDCNGLTDDGLVFLNYYVDGDNDGFGAGAATSSCAPIAGSVLVDGDCDDNNAAINPAATEVCNSIDDDCNGLTDDGLVFLNYYVDGDNDGFGAGAATSSCAPIAGSVLVDGDCDDNNAAVNPAATEVCNSIDDDCDGSTDEGVLLTFYADADADSYGNAAVSTLACSAPVGYVADNTDCDDNNASINPAAVEVCNNIDDNCNGLTDDGLVFLNYYVDGDNDGFGAGAATSSCSPIAGSVLVDGDCDDNNASVNPAAIEVCNSIDDDCNGSTDEGVLLTFYADADADSYGNAAVSTLACSAPVGYVADNTDCDDNNASINPAAVEVCNNIDDNCNGLTDDGLVFLNYYVDGDNDGFGAGAATSSCSPIAGSVLVDGDCDDNNAAVNPSATEVCNNIDDDCNGLTDDGLLFLNYYVDADNDGFGAGAATSSCNPIAGSVLVDGDCDDNNTAVNPAAVEVCNNIDDDCNGLTDDGLVFLNYYVDGDNDGFGAGAATSSCAPIAGSVLADGDCDDNNAAVNPAATEVCNSIDDDCDGSTDEGVLLTFYADADADSYGNAAVSTLACSAPVGYVADNTDCDDNNASINPAAVEVCNNIDDDCNGLTDDGLVFLNYYVDGDNDGFGAGAATSSCAPIAGSVLVDGDCEDNNAAVNPSATEVCNNIDDDCNGLTDDGLVFLNYYVDGDNDGFGAGAATSSCAPIAGSVLVDGDCDDNNAAVNPAATEVCNSIDDDCDGSTDEGVLLTFYADADADSYGNATVSTLACSAPVGYVADNTDCDDNNAAVNPAATEICNAIDDDCNGLTDDGLVFLNYYVDGDNDGFGAGAATSSCAPIAGSVLVDGDCDDNNAAVNPSATEVCNSIDDDCDGSTDEGVLLTFYADADADTYGNAAVSTLACSAPVGYVADNTDCDDNNASINPAAVEVCNNIDDDCNGLTDDGLVFLNYYVDGDNDGFGAGAATSSCAPIAGSVLVDGDCDDNNAAVNPAAIEVCNNIDDDCNGLTDDGLVFLNYYVDGDNDGFGAGAATSSCAPIAGSVLVDGDCEDNNAAVNPAAIEVCNNIDDNCNGLTDDGLVFLNYYVDGDNDGFGAGAATSSCAPIAGSVLVDGDCDDNNAAVNPSANEVCNNIDDDCNGLTDDGLVFLNYYVDGDNDGFGAGAATSSCAPIAGSVLVDGDCDDNNAAVNPAAVEVCNSIDDDCDGSTDEGVLLTFYADADADSYGNAAVSAQACSAPVGYVADNTDCDDNNAAVNPAAVEICNAIDDDCNGLTDDGLVFLNYYVDGDNDGFGAGAATSSCAPIAGSVLVDGDCDDNNAAINPGAAEICNNIDDDCNGLTDDGLVFLNYYVDGDNDGFGAGAATSSCAPIAGSVLVDGDCDDNNAAVNPSATEVCNSIDDDCDGSTDEGVLLTFYADADADTYGNAAVSTLACSAPVGYVADNTDCDDNNASINPAAVEVCNNIDDDCNGLTDDGLVFLNYYVDGDNDGFGAGAATSSCAPIAGSVLVDGDCDDNNSAVNPAATEVCNNIDDDCNGLTDDGLVFLNYYVDGDNDGFGAGTATSSCSPIAGSVLVDGDCDDNNAAINPAATEVCNSIDDDCDGSTDEGVLLTFYADADADSYGNAAASTLACSAPVGYVADNTDCDDNNASINPAAVEVCNNIDDDCNGLTDDGLVFLNYYVDGDNDGFGAGAATSSCAPIAGSVLVDGDCDDNNAAVNPAAVEVCNNIDDDCNGLTDDGLVFLNYYVDGDNDGFGAGAATSSCAPIAGSVLVDGDCDDNNAAINPAAVEVCNSIDDDCDGSTDEGVLLTFYADADADSYGNATVSTLACSAPVGYVADNTDCDDNNASINPAAVEVCNNIDDDCNGLTDDGLVFLNYYVDADNDGFGAGTATSSCSPIAGSVLVDGDCDDNNATINPGAAEICNNIDDNCNGLTDDGLVFLDYFTDADNDGFGTGAAISSCTPISGAVLAEGDCDDNNNAVHPGATELCNGIDDDCDGLTDDNVFVPLGSISGPAQQCVPATFSFATFSITPPAGANFFNWTVPSGMSIYAGQGTNSVLVTWSGQAVHNGISGPMTVTVGTVCGGIAVASVDIDINYTNPVLPPSISGPSKVCQGDVVTYSVSNVARAKTYTWTVPAGLSIISGQGTNVITASVGGGYNGGSISVYASNFCGNGPARSKTITFNTPLTPAPIVGQASGLCGATNISFTTAGAANASGYNWTVPSGVSIVSGQGSNTILVDVVSGFISGNITVTGVNGCGTGSARSISIIGAPGQAAPISGPTAICPGATNIIYEVPTIAGATNYTWTVPGSATIISGQGTKQITVNYNALQTSNQVITVRASNGCGQGALRSLSGISINSVNCGGPRQSLSMLKDVIAYPNPATDVVNIQFYSEESNKYIVRILDLSGRTIYMEEGFSNTGENAQQLNLADLESGIYYVELTSAGQTEKIKLMVE